MRLDRISLSNIGCHTNIGFDFDELTVVYGENRTGKTTMVNSIFFSLFGDHLDGQLTAKDLTRVGEPYGTAVLECLNEMSNYRIIRRTNQSAELSTRADQNSSWESIPVKEDKDIRSILSINSDVATLTSFFREGELIYFIRDIPKYNHTLLQNMVQMDNVFIAVSRLKKASALADSELKRLHGGQSGGTQISSQHVNEARKTAEDLEKKFFDIDQEIKSLTSNKPQEEIAFLKKRISTIESDIASLEKEMNRLPDQANYDKQIQAYNERLKELEPMLAVKEETIRNLGRVEKAVADLEMDINALNGVAEDNQCRLCGNSLSEAEIAKLHQKKEPELFQFKQERSNGEHKLKEIYALEKEKSVIEKELKTIENGIKALINLDKQAAELSKQLTEAQKAVKNLGVSQKDLDDFDYVQKRRMELENARTKFQQRIINAKVAHRQIEELHRNVKKQKIQIAGAERSSLICNMARKCAENAMQALNSTLLTSVKENLRAWSTHFDFLDQFDINIKSDQLMPIIRARGYQYKLNQMSKSERIFLYLMLKLSIGDALSHLGVFILDDPADGLDTKRKKLLAELLTSISKKRQIIVTSNDEVFSDMFKKGNRINL